jgi:hypothetical protein
MILDFFAGIFDDKPDPEGAAFLTGAQVLDLLDRVERVTVENVGDRLCITLDGGGIEVATCIDRIEIARDPSVGWRRIEGALAQLRRSRERSG